MINKRMLTESQYTDRSVKYTGISQAATNSRKKFSSSRRTSIVLSNIICCSFNFSKVEEELSYTDNQTCLACLMQSTDGIGQGEPRCAAKSIMTTSAALLKQSKASIANLGESSGKNVNYMPSERGKMHLLSAKTITGQ